MRRRNHALRDEDSSTVLNGGNVIIDLDGLGFRHKGEVGVFNKIGCARASAARSRARARGSCERAFFFARAAASTSSFSTPSATRGSSSSARRASSA